jgi:hypothetical protein
MSPQNLRRVIVYGFLGVAVTGLFLMRRTLWHRALAVGPAAAREHVPTVDGAIKAYGKKSDKRFRLVCQRAGIDYPPKKVTLVALRKRDGGGVGS